MKFDIKRLLCFTDIHFGARLNSEQHLQDCSEFIAWFIRKAKDTKATHIAFLGDWFENRSAINVRTLQVASECADALNALGLPVFFIVGNHDLFFRHNRSVFSTAPYKSLENFHLISETTELSDTVLAAPFLFKQEYIDQAEQINKYKFVLGHFEFKNFVVTGQTKTLDHGPDADLFFGPKYILSGHFHKRQVNKNIVYIGNTFPTNYGDVWDTERGCALLDLESETIEFFDYDGPTFYSMLLSDMLMKAPVFKNGGRVRCILDVDMTYSEVQLLRDEFTKQFNLREFCIEEDIETKMSTLNDGIELATELDTSSLDATVQQLIAEGVQPSPNISPVELIAIYKELDQ
jgi:DNA repair exonuclease SbcCD nuclease subunit